MKYLILLFSMLFIFNSYAGFVAPNKEGFFRIKKICEQTQGAKCFYVEYRKDLNLNDFALENEYKNGEAINSKSPISQLASISKCGEYCQVLYEKEGYTCEDPKETLILNLELEEIYCSKFLRFEQILTGEKILKFSEVKKSARLKIIADKKELKDKDDARKAIAFEALKQTCATTQDPVYKNLCILLMK